MNRSSPVARTSEILFVTTLCFGWSIVISVVSVMSGFQAGTVTDAAMFEGIATELLLGAVALGFLRSRRYDLALLKPAPTTMGSLTGLALFAAATVAALALKAIFAGGDTSAQAPDQLVAGAAISLAPMIALSIINALYEETFLVGFLQRALGGHGAAFAIGASLLVRISYQLFLGPAGVAYTLGFGIVLSLYFLRTGKLWPVVMAHTLDNLRSLIVLV